MAVLIKIIIVFLSFIIGLEYIGNSNIICSVVSLSLCAYFINNLHKQFNYYLDDNWSSSKDDFLFNDNRTKPISNISKNKFNGFSFNNNKSVIKKIENRFEDKTHNFIEFVDKPKYLVKHNPKEKMVINNINPLKPKLDIKKEIRKFESNEKRNNKFDGADVIMIANSENMDDAKKIVYDSIINAIDDKSLKPNERYALLQSFFYVDICPTSVVIYIDKLILEKAYLTVESLCKEKIIQNIKNSLYFPDIEVQFIELKTVSLLNYYIK